MKLYLPNSINDWVVNCIGFGEQRAPDGEKRTDFNKIEDARPIDDQIWSPSHEP